MNVTCPQLLSCPGSTGLENDFPIANYSSEEPDRLLFIGLNWGWDLNLPPLGSNWSHANCLGICVSAISQEDADLCAARANLECLELPGGDPTGGDGGGGPPFICQTRPDLCAPLFPGTQIYRNHPRSCSYTCPDGSLSSFTVGAGTFSATSQAKADAMAFSYACSKARQNALCLGNLADFLCTGTFIDPESMTIGLSVAHNPPFVFTLVSGEIPIGMAFDQFFPDFASLWGTPTVAGTYVFTVQCSNAAGISVQKTYTVTVLGITNPALPDATVGTAYSQMLQGAGGVAPYSFSTSDPLPAGLTLHSDGTVDGTPTTPGTYTFNVTITDSE